MVKHLVLAVFLKRDTKWNVNTNKYNMQIFCFSAAFSKYFFVISFKHDAIYTALNKRCKYAYLTVTTKLKLSLCSTYKYSHFIPHTQS